MIAKNYIVFKRIIDFLLSLLAIILLSPILIIVAIFIKIDSRGPIFYKQTRFGKNKKKFILLKFRSMTHKQRTNHQQILKGNSEVTKIGRVMRRTKIDELPQLFNVLRGEMSIVGPRPCLPEMENRFGKYSSLRFDAKPGLTSYAAIKGSIYLSWEQKGIYDYIYIKNISLVLDCLIIIETFKVMTIGEEKLFLSKKQ